MLRKFLLWFFCKIGSPIISPSLWNYRCLYCHEKHGVFVESSPSRMMARDIGEQLQDLKSPTKRALDAGDSAASQALSPLSSVSTSEQLPAATQRK